MRRKRWGRRRGRGTCVSVARRRPTFSTWRTAASGCDAASSAPARRRRPRTHRRRRGTRGGRHRRRHRLHATSSSNSGVGRRAVPPSPTTDSSRPPSCSAARQTALGRGARLQNILRQSYDYFTIMPKLRSTYDGRPIYKTSYEGCRAFLRYDSLAKL